MKRIKYAMLPALLAALLALSGCRMALDERTGEQNRLVGLSITVTDGYDSAYDTNGVNRLQPHEPDGAVVRLCFETDENGDAILYDFSDGRFDPPQMTYHVTNDDSVAYSLETTLYLIESRLPERPILRVESVYQREDGTLFAINGGHNYSGVLDGVGVTLSESCTTTDASGRTIAESTTLKLNVRYEAEVVSASAVEMRGADEALTRHELGEQENIRISAEAEWLLIEETLADGSVRRSAINAPLADAQCSVRIAGEAGMCIPKSYRFEVAGSAQIS